MTTLAIVALVWLIFMFIGGETLSAIVLGIVLYNAGFFS